MRKYLKPAVVPARLLVQRLLRAGKRHMALGALRAMNATIFSGDSANVIEASCMCAALEE